MVDSRSGEMDVFVTVAEQGSFSEAARRLRLTPSAVSKLVTRIEDRLQARLFFRSTRALRLSPEGEAYLARARLILAEIEDAERSIADGASARPRGKLRVSVSVGFGVTYIVPMMPEFLRCYPDIELDLLLSDTIVDLLEERVDIALRSGPLRDSSLKARKILQCDRVIVGAPAYLAAHGIPRHPGELDAHNCMTLSQMRNFDHWPFRLPSGQAVEQPVSGTFQTNNGPTLRQLCLAGVGLGRMGRFNVQADIDAGRLVPVLEDFYAGDDELIHALYAPHQHLAARVRAFIDFLVERVAASHIDSH